MLLKGTIRFVFSFTVFLLCAGFAAAQGPVANSNTTTSRLEMTANVQTAVQLNVSTAAGGATVSGSNSTGLYSVSFGDVNGLGTGTPVTGVSVSADSTGALYKTPITLTPIYSGFTTETADIDVSAGTSGDEDLAREGNAGISSSSTVGSTPTNVISNAASGSSNTRYVGFYVPRTEAAGAKTATLIYTITVQP